MEIKELEIYTSKIDDQIKFYHEVLELEMIKKSGSSVSFKIGNSILKLTYRKECTPYHFAINIPSNREKQALQWLKERVEVLTYEGIETQYFDFWNAYAIYFYDVDKNIVEFIARKKLQKDSNTKFDNNSLLGISEIGIPTSTMVNEYQILNNSTGVKIHSGTLERFCAVGDENGLFILINKEIKKWFPTMDVAMSSDFKIKFSEKGKKYMFIYENEKLHRIA